MGVARSKEFSYSCSLTLTRFMGFFAEDTISETISV